MSDHPTHKVLQSIRVSEGNTLWQEVGVAWESKDDSTVSIQLDSIPLSGRIILKRTIEELETGAL